MKVKKLKLYIYPNAREHVQDNMEEAYSNTVPFSRKGLADHCESVTPDEADYFYMGQVSCGLPLPGKDEFKYFEGNEERHIIDFEGDWFHSSIPDWLRKSLISVTGIKKEYSGINIFPRLPLSYLLLDIIRNNRKRDHVFEPNKSFGFKGFPDPRGIRLKSAVAVEWAGVKSDIHFNDAWQAKAAVNTEMVQSYCDAIVRNTFFLCPAGTGVDSIRFFEVCYFSSIPIVLSDAFTMGHEINKEEPFYFQIDPYTTVEEMVEKFKKIEQTSLPELKKMSENASKFFEHNIRRYFEDPTLRFIEWLDQEKKHFD
jgi:hypothetical protein